MDVTIKGVPEEIGELKVKEWVSVLIERYHNKKVNEIPEVTAAINKAKTDIDGFKEANNIPKEKEGRHGIDK